MELEKPRRRLFRLQIVESGGGGDADADTSTPTSTARRSLRFFTCDRVVNETMVWDRVPVDDLGGEAMYTLILIHRISGEVLLNRSYKAWSFHDHSSAMDIARDLTDVDDDACVVFVKWCARSKEQSDMAFAEGTVWREAGSDKYLSTHDDDEASTKDDDEEDFYSSFEGVAELNKGLTRMSEKRSITSISMTPEEKKLLSFIGDMSFDGGGNALLDMAEAIAWSGGDASYISSAATYVLLGTNLRRRMDCPWKNATQSVGYQYWRTKDGQVFERSLNENQDITQSESANLAEGFLAGLVMTTPQDDESVMHVVEDVSGLLRARMCFDERSFMVSSIRKRSTGETLVWKKRRRLGLPSYLELCRLEYAEMLRGGTDSWLLYCCAAWTSPVRAMLVVAGLGHFLTSVGRRAWYVVIWKYLRFLLLCFGYWTDDLVEMYDVHGTLRRSSLVWTHPSLKAKVAKDAQRASIALAGGEVDVDDCSDSDTDYGNRDTDIDGDGESDKIRDDPIQYDDSIGENLHPSYFRTRSLRLSLHHTDETNAMRELPKLTLKILFRRDYTNAISTIVSTRATVLQLVPGLAVLSIFANLISAYPMLVYARDLELSLPELVCRDAGGLARKVEGEFTSAVNKIFEEELHEDDYCIDIPQTLLDNPNNTTAQISRNRIEEHNELSRTRMRACIAQSPLLVREWIVKLRTVMLFVTQSRIIMLLYEIGNFGLIMGLLFGVESKKSVTAFVIVSLVLILPMCMVSCLYFYVLLGRCLYITDRDLEIFAEFVRDHCEKCSDFFKPMTNAVSEFCFACFSAESLRRKKGRAESGRDTECEEETRESCAPDLDSIYLSTGSAYDMDNSSGHVEDMRYTDNPLGSMGGATLSFEMNPMLSATAENAPPPHPLDSEAANDDHAQALEFDGVYGADQDDELNGPPSYSVNPMFSNEST